MCGDHGREKGDDEEDAFHRSNVKDEPRWQSALTRTSARGVTDGGVGSGVWLG